jgi:hypothetical protein
MAMTEGDKRARALSIKPRKKVVNPYSRIFIEPRKTDIQFVEDRRADYLANSWGCKYGR